MRATDARPANMRRTEGSAAVPAKPATMSAKACEVTAATVPAAATVSASAATMPAATAAAGVCLECDRAPGTSESRPGHRQRDAAARGPPRGCLVGAPGAAFAVIEDPENEAGGSDALRGCQIPCEKTEHLTV
jgi:hypothetical protein